MPSQESIDTEHTDTVHRHSTVNKPSPSQEYSHFAFGSVLAMPSHAPFHTSSQSFAGSIGAENAEPTAAAAAAVALREAAAAAW